MKENLECQVPIYIYILILIYTICLYISFVNCDDLQFGKCVPNLCKLFGEICGRDDLIMDLLISILQVKAHHIAIL